MHRLHQVLRIWWSIGGYSPPGDNSIRDCSCITRQTLCPNLGKSMAFFCILICRVHSVFFLVSHFNTNYSTRVAKQVGFFIPRHGLHYWADKNTGDFFPPLAVCNNMLFNVISFPISSLLFCHFSLQSSVNSRDWSLNH